MLTQKMWNHTKKSQISDIIHEVAYTFLYFFCYFFDNVTVNLYFNCSFLYFLSGIFSKLS